MTWAIPAAAGALGAVSTLRGARADSRALAEQARVTGLQANRDEEAQRREARQVIGAQAASMAQAGGGLDEKALEQSSLSAELDALNIRYSGIMRARGLLTEARSIKKQAPLLAAAQLLSGAAGSSQARRQGGYA